MGPFLAKGESEGDPSGGWVRRRFLKVCSAAVPSAISGLGVMLIGRALSGGPGPLPRDPILLTVSETLSLTGSATLSLHATADITLGALTVMATGTACGPSDSTLTV